MAVVFAIGFIWGWRERENFASKKVDALLMHIDSSVHERIEESRIDIKIEKEGLIAYDIFFNIGDLQVNYIHKAIDNADIEIIKTNA